MPVAGGLGAAERQVYLGADGRSVDICNTGIEVTHGAKGFVYVASVNRGGESIDHAVGHLDGPIKTVARNQREHWPKNFLLGNAHFVVCIAENRGLVEPTVRVGRALQTMSAAQQVRTFILADLHVLF